MLGLGKNMVESLAFWTEATGVAIRDEDHLLMSTEFGRKVFSRKDGYDPYLENMQTLWLLHWQLCRGWKRGARRFRPYAWHFFANVFSDNEISTTEAVDHFAGAVSTFPRPLSSTTLQQHFNVFIRTYVPGERSGPRSTPEDALDSPLIPLGLITRSGERKLTDSRREVVYRFNTSVKPSISQDTFRYALHDWWNRNRDLEERVTLREVALAEGSPGRVFKLPESDIFDRLSDLASKHGGELQMVDSQNQRAIERKRRRDSAALLPQVYRCRK